MKRRIKKLTDEEYFKKSIEDALEKAAKENKRKEGKVNMVMRLINFFKKNKKEENKEMGIFRKQFPEWSKEEKEYLLYLKNKGFNFEEMMTKLNEKYNNNRTECAVQTRLYLIKHNLNGQGGYLQPKHNKEEYKFNKPEYFKNTYDLIEDIKNGREVSKDVMEKMKLKAKSFDEAVSKDYYLLAKKHQQMLPDFSEELKKILEESQKPIRKVWYFAIKAKEEDLKKIFDKQMELVEQERITFPKAKITLSQCKD